KGPRNNYVVTGRKTSSSDLVDALVWPEREKAMICSHADEPAVGESNSENWVGGSVPDDMRNGLPTDLSSFPRKTWSEDVARYGKRPIFPILQVSLAKVPDRDQLKPAVPQDCNRFVRMEALSASVESRPIKETPEDVRHLFLHDPGPVVFDDDEELVLVHFVDFHKDIRNNFGLLGRVQRIFDSLFHDREERLRGRVVSEDLLVPLEELGNADLPLFLREFLSDRDRRPGITGGRR